MDEEQIYQLAKKRADSKMRFYFHLVVYLGVNSILIVVNLKTSPAPLWFLWPLCVWGICLILHGLVVLDVFNLAAARKLLLEKELAKEKYRRQLDDNK